MVNHVILVGNLTRDAETNSGPATTYTRMRIATNSVWYDTDGVRQERAEYHSVVAFGRTAEICGQYCVKGRQVYVEGRLRTRDYESPDGLRRLTTEIVADTVRLLGRPAGSGAAGSADPDPDPMSIELGGAQGGETTHDTSAAPPPGVVDIAAEPAQGRRARALAS